MPLIQINLDTTRSDKLQLLFMYADIYSIGGLQIS